MHIDISTIKIKLNFQLIKLYKQILELTQQEARTVMRSLNFTIVIKAPVNPDLTNKNITQKPYVHN